MKISKLILALSYGLTSAISHAQDAAGIDLGGFELIPSLNASLQYDDNVARSDSNESSSWVSVITPQFVLNSDYNGNLIKLGYRMVRGDYYSSAQDDFTDHIVFSSIDYDLNSRHRLTASVEFEDGHDDRGTRYSIGRGSTLSGPDLFKQSQFQAGYSYGVDSATVKLDFNLDYRKLNYDLNTEDYLIRDRDNLLLGSTLFYSVSAATQLTFDARYRSINYKYTPGTSEVLDSKEPSLLIGAEWQASALTNGYVKLGVQRKDFESSQRNDFTGATWLAGIQWNPNELNSVEVTTNGGTRETNGEGNFIKSKDISLKWRHDWLERLSTDVSLGYGKDDYEGEDNVRKDNTTQLKLGLNYQFRRWLKFDLSYGYEDRDSNREAIAYDRRVYRLNAYITL